MKNIISLKKVSVFAFMLTMSAMLYAQDTAEKTEAPVNKPVTGTFEYGVAINSQTVEGPAKNALNFIIQHRFGVIKESKDLFGLYAPSNIRIGFNYGITDRLSAGVGVTKNKMIYDLEWKYIIFKQEKPGGIPVTVTYYGDAARSALDEANFINQDSVYKGANRVSYFHELMIARKLNKHISLQAAFTYTHYNLVDSAMAKDQIKDHDFMGLAFVGKYNFSPQSSVLFDVGMPLKQREYVTEVNTATSKDVTTLYYPRINLGLGVEVSTGSHQFQFFVTTADAIINQEISVYNMNNISDGDIMFGFNITRKWGF